MASCDNERVADWKPPPPIGLAAQPHGGSALLVVSQPGGVVSSWEGSEPAPELRAMVAERASELSARVLPGRHQEAGCVFLRLTVRPVPGDDVTSSASYSIGFEAGCGGAPADHPRLPARALFEHAASVANQ